MPRVPKSQKVSDKPVNEVLGKMKESPDSGIKSIKETVDAIHRVVTQPPPVPEKKPRKKRILSDEQKAVLRERLQKARQVKQDKKKIEQ